MGAAIHRTTHQYIESVNTPDYPTVDWIINPDLSALSAVAKKYWKIVGDVVSEMTQGEKDTVDTADLPAYKAATVLAIDTRTQELIALGFTYASKQFSLSLTAQSKMTGTHQVKDDPAMTYPLKWNTLGDDDAHELADAAALDGFYLTGLGTIRAHLDSGTALKDSVKSAADAAAVDAVVDTR